MAGRVLRSGDPVGVRQEMWSLLSLYQVLRTVMVEAAESRPGTDPDRVGFTIAFQTARDQVIQAAGVTGADRIGVIGGHVLAALLPRRRPRVSTRKVKSPISRYHERQADGRPDTSRTATDLDITVLEPPIEAPPLPSVSRDDRYAGQGETRRDQVLALLRADPGRHWRTQAMARHLGDVTLGTMYRQLTRWSQAGLLQKTSPGTYTA